jgi:hypothetical protein
VAPGAQFANKLYAFLSSHFWSWAFKYLEFRFTRKHKFQTYGPEEDGRYSLSGDSWFTREPDPQEEVRISIAGDWGTGTAESNAVAAAMMESEPHFTIHLGDVYFVGDPVDVEENCLGKPPGPGSPGVTWPIGSRGAFTLNSNHEMYANGNGYFDKFLPKVGLRPARGAEPDGQKASYFCLQNEWWNIIALDTGYNSIGLPFIEIVFSPSCKQRREVLEWLRNTLCSEENDNRGLIILSHHQYYSSFDQMYPKTARQLKTFIDRPVLWFWGHEHRMAVYGKYSIKDGIEAYGRCIGHGGMPIDINMNVKKGAEKVPLVLCDDRQYSEFDEHHAGFNGFVNLTFRENQLTVEYRTITKDLTLDPKAVLQEIWQVTDGGLLVGGDIRRQNPDPAIKQPRDLRVANGSHSRAYAGADAERLP